MSNGANLSGNRSQNRADYITFSRTAFTFLVSVVLLLFAGTGSVIWESTATVIRLTEKIESIDRLENRIGAIEAARAIHEARANNLIGRWEQQFATCERRLDILEKDCKNMMRMNRQ